VNPPIGPDATGDAVVWQKKLHDALMRQDSIGGLHHGTTIEVYLLKLVLPPLGGSSSRDRYHGPGACVFSRSSRLLI